MASKKNKARFFYNSLFKKVKKTTPKKMIVGLSNSIKNINEYKKQNSQNITRVRLSMKEQTFFAKRLSFLIKANIPILDSLYMIREQTTSKRYGKVMDTVIRDVANGQYLSTSLEKFNRTFGDFAINIINVGETSGILSENLDYLSEELQKKQLLRRKVIGAFVYPAIVTFATIGITVFLMIYLFPKIMPVFTSLHIALPLSTRIVIALSNFLRLHGFTLITILIALSIAFSILLKKSKKFHYTIDKLILRIPVLGAMIQYYNLSNITRTMGLLLKSGITLTEALPITEKTTGNSVYKNEMSLLLSSVSRGEKLSNHLQKNKKLFPDILCQIVAVGERGEIGRAHV